MNLAALLDGHPPDRVALVHDGATTTYGVLADRVARVRGGLARLGLGDGDRVGLLIGNTPAFVVAEMAAVGLGLVVVPLDPLSPAAEVAGQLGVVGAAAAVADATGLRALAGVDRRRVPALTHVIASGTGTAADPAAAPTAAAPTDVGPTAAAPVVSATLDELASAPPRPAIDVPADHLAALLFTSGTAGPPRAAMLSHGNLRANVDQSRAATPLAPDDVVFGVLPLFHIYGLNVALHGTFAAGAAIVLVPRFVPADALATIRDRRITVVPGVPSLWTALARHDGARTDDLASVRLALSGGARLSDADALEVAARLGVVLLDGYGLTEASPAVTTSTGVTPRLGSIGVALPGVEVRLVDADGDDVLTDDPGELWVRGPNVFPGYWEDPEATARALTPDGWLRTGDIGVVDDEGYVYLVDRAKDLVIVSGFNVHPAEVEDVIALLPAVRDVAVVGVADATTGEAVEAVVVAHGLTAEDVFVHCRAHLARYKCPTRVRFIDAVPRNAAGKLVRRAVSG